MARNRCLDELRRRRLLTFSELAAGEEEAQVLPLVLLPDPAPLPEELLEWHELQQSLQAAIDALPPRVRAVVLLRTQAQLSYGEIGQALGMPVSTAKTAFFRAKRLLRASCQLDGVRGAQAQPDDTESLTLARSSRWRKSLTQAGDS